MDIPTLTESQRGYLYRVLCALGLVLVLHGAITDAELEVYLILAAEILGTGLAARNTTVRSLRRPRPPTG